MTSNEGHYETIHERYEGYALYDPEGERIGEPEDIFVDDDGQVEYIGVKLGSHGSAHTTLIPSEVTRYDEGQSEGQKRIKVSRRKGLIEEAPAYDDDGEITPEFLRRVRSHYGLDDAQGPVDEGSSSDHRGDEDRDEGDAGAQTSGAARATETGESGHGGLEQEDVGPEQEASGSRGDGDLGDGNEITVQRSEEELRAGVREREAGKVTVKKRVRTERERIAVPKKREEVSVERMAVDEEASEGQIGEEDLGMRVVEEEVVVDKRAVVKEELRIKKDVVEEEEVVEEDVRKEEVDIDDSSGTVGDR